MDSAQRASRILARIQRIDWKTIDPKLQDEKKVDPKFPDDPKQKGPQVSGNTDKPELRHMFAGNWRTSTGKGRGGPV